MLRWAVECNCPLLVRKIMSRGGKPEVVDKNGRNTIKASKFSYNKEIQKYLINNFKNEKFKIRNIIIKKCQHLFRVRKRNGTLEDVSFDKITEQTND